MKKDEPTCTVNTLLTAIPPAEDRSTPAHHSWQTLTGIPQRDREAIRPKPRPGSFTLWEIALVAAAPELLPRPAYIPAALLLPVVYLIARGQTRLFIVAASALIALTPSLITGAELDSVLGSATIVALTPLYLRLFTWWDRTGRWDILDPLVIAGAPIWFVTLPVLVFRLFLLGSLASE